MVDSEAVEAVEAVVDALSAEKMAISPENVLMEEDLEAEAVEDLEAAAFLLVMDFVEDVEDSEAVDDIKNYNLYIFV